MARTNGDSKASLTHSHEKSTRQRKRKGYESAPQAGNFYKFIIFKHFIELQGGSTAANVKSSWADRCLRQPKGPSQNFSVNGNSKTCHCCELW
eukprot:NODE_944_length_715_cov_601.076577_g732_i0.p1 GENE.NODE_944_length_715_cov_601.076577_g732_i0~~NODE_944_length_715_cov_601.076577_g732_i0.p1  ORF type:complete len:93 (+),score=3.02 NODE_944_length_715_cov_601.076577_g732_i0:372-650(+)